MGKQRDGKGGDPEGEGNLEGPVEWVNDGLGRMSVRYGRGRRSADEGDVAVQGG